MQIAIAGNIGAGKTSLAKLLAKHYRWDSHFESVDNNPYLYDFYNEMERWSFNLQVFFLNTRIEQILKIQKHGKNTIQDRTIYEDAKIFAANLHSMGLMKNRDYKNYLSLFNLMENLITPPYLLIYLRANIKTLVEQIQKRGRAYERNIRIDYLSSLNNLYEDWASKYDKGKMLVIDVNDIDFVENKEDLGKIIERVDTQINGLF